MESYAADREKLRAPRTMLEIRDYEPGDAGAVWDLHNLALRGTGAHLGNGPWDADLKRIPEIYQSDGGVFLVGSLDGRIVAMGGLKRTSAGRAEVKRMRVHPGFHRRGFGTAILLALESRAARLGYRLLHLDTTTLQVPAQRLYEKHGYRVAGQTVVGGLDVLLYEKNLTADGFRLSGE